VVETSGWGRLPRRAKRMTLAARDIAGIDWTQW
jgi:hypothetical protein